MRMLRNGSVQSTTANGSCVAPHGIDQRTFSKRLKALYSHWRQHKDELWGSADFFAIATPPLSLDNISYLKSSTFKRWLLGYEFPETVTVFGKKQIHFLCNQKKNASLLETVKRSVKEAVDVDVVVHRKPKGKNGTSKIYYVIHSMRTSNSEVHDEPIVGYIAKESPQGFLLEKWADKLKSRGLQLSDVTNGLSDLLANEVPDELIQQKNEETARRLARRDSSADDDYRANLNTLNELNAYCGPKLVLTKNEPNLIRLSCLYIHPPFAGHGSIKSGTLEAHANGFWYSTSRRDEQVEIMYANIKHAFVQPPMGMVLTISLIHFHLHNHIMVGDKKTNHVQFSIEKIHVLPTLEDKASWNINAKESRRNYYNDLLGKTDFESFVSKVDDLWNQPQFKKLNLKFERLQEKYGFEGTIAPDKPSVFMVPTKSCLVDLMFTHFLVIPISEIEIVNLERVGFSVQTDFDMVIVFKNFKRDVMRIDSISFEEYDTVLEWLDSTAVQYFETRVNLHWRAIIKTFTDDPQAFIDVGGWDFLNREKEIFIDNGGGFMYLDLAATDFWPGQLDPRIDQNDICPNNDSESDNSDYGDTQSCNGCSAPKRRRLKKKAAIGKMRFGPCFSASKRRRIKKAAFGKGRAGPCSSTPKRSKLM